MLLCALSVVFGQPAAGVLLIGRLEFSDPWRVEVPLVMNRRRGLLDLSRRGTKVDVMIWVPTVLTFQEAFQAWRIVSFPECSCWSNWAPKLELERVLFMVHQSGHTRVVH